jgi:hypothetical protein
MTDAPDGIELAEEPDDDQTEDELDPRVSTPDDGIENGDELDSETEQARLDDLGAEGYDPDAADEEGEH